MEITNVIRRTVLRSVNNSSGRWMFSKVQQQMQIQIELQLQIQLHVRMRTAQQICKRNVGEKNGWGTTTILSYTLCTLGTHTGWHGQVRTLRMDSIIHLGIAILQNFGMWNLFVSLSWTFNFNLQCIICVADTPNVDSLTRTFCLYPLTISIGQKRVYSLWQNNRQ